MANESPSSRHQLSAVERRWIVAVNYLASRSTAPSYAFARVFQNSLIDRLDPPERENEVLNSFVRWGVFRSNQRRFHTC